MYEAYSYFLCKGLHKAREFLRQKKLNAMLEEMKVEEDTCLVNLLQLLNGLSFTPWPCHFNLMRVAARINGVEVRVGGEHASRLAKEVAHVSCLKVSTGTRYAGDAHEGAETHAYVGVSETNDMNQGTVPSHKHATKRKVLPCHSLDTCGQPCIRQQISLAQASGDAP
ncbi:unnamed protein product [Citrullus colocynthis]|uniref:Uncharacterized protein n=1 Tax=Citrullus colocynthis TaxID=252529 RepID=A0ABP0YTQ0_9ROSI